MKFTFNRDTLLKEISIAQEIIATKNALSILSNVMLIAENGNLTIRATDIKVNFETKIPVEVEEKGSTTIFCDKFQSILSSLPTSDIEFIQKETKILIKPITKKASFQLKSMASDKFPEFEMEGNMPYFDIAAVDFKEMIKQTIFAISDDETRYFMNGIYLEKKENNLNMVATDGRRLAFITKEIEQNISDFQGIIIPPKILSIISKKAPSEGPISIAISEKTIFFKFGNYEFSSVLIEGQFPNYQRVIPEKQTDKLEINRHEFLEALKRVSLLVEQKSRRIYLTVSPGTLTISSQESEIGTAKEEIPCKYDGKEITIAVNHLYIEEPLKTMETENLVIEFTEAMKAITVKSEPESDFFHIVMPMQME